jgi:hypothetical protein
VVVALGTLAAIVTTMIVAAPGGAAAPLKEFSATFEPECVVAPGVLNIKAKVRANLRAMAPETVETGEMFNAEQASSSITSPVELTEQFVSLGVHEVRGHITNFVLDGTNAEPAKINSAKPAEFPSGLPFFAPVEKGKAVTFSAPSLALGESGRTFSFGPFTVTGAAGQTATQTVDPAKGFEEVGSEIKATGNGIVTEIEGFNEKGERAIGPLTVACTAPAGVVVASIPIKAATTTSTTTSSPTTTTTTTSPTTTTTTTSPTTTTTTTKSTTTTTTTTTKSTTTTTSPTTTTTTTTTSTSSNVTEIKFENWKLTGSLTVKKLKEAINLPEGCTFNGHAFIPGALEGNTFCPPFKARIKLLSLLPTTLGLTLTESEPVHGTITPGHTSGDLLFKATSKQNIGITSITLLGLTVPTNCTTETPVVFPLELEAPASSLVTGATFTGETTLPNVKCQGGLLGSALGQVISALLSGPNNPFSLTIKPS